MIKKFSLPDYYGKGNLILNIVQYRKAHPTWFYEDRIIDSCYGSHPNILWTGGRSLRIVNIPEIPMKTILANFNHFPEISLRHVCTNLFITEELTLDYKSNYFMERYIRKNDSVIIASPVLIDYFKTKYPKIPLVYSTTMNITDIDKVNEVTENNLYVLNYNYNTDDEYIKKLQHPENIEILCAEPCIPNCPKRMEHYEIISKDILGLTNYPYICGFDSERRTFGDIMQLPHAVPNERVEELSNMGIQYFKISGRAFTVPNWLYCILYYLMKPEYLLKAYIELLATWW